MAALEQQRPRYLAVGLLAGYLLLLASLTLAPPNYVPRQRLRLVPFATIMQQYAKGGSTFLVNVPGNIVAFAPLGLLAPLSAARLRSFTRIVLLGVAISAGIELLQLNFTRRVADIDDVLLNGVGTGIGYATYYLYSAWSSGRPTNKNA